MHIDLVIPWVDGEDASHRRKRLHWASIEGVKDSECRYRNNDELRFLLRSVEQHWPFEGMIYIVTDNQRPSWLNTDHPRIFVVDHKDFIPEQYLPTFNPKAIDANLHRIRGLSERYVVMNDDMFFSRTVEWSDLFDGGCTFRIRHEPLPQSDEGELSHETRSAMLARQWVVDRNGAMSIAVEHGVGPRGIRKDWMEALECMDPEAFENASKERFLTAQSNTQSVVSHLYTAWCVAEGRSKTHADNNLTIPTGNEGMHWLMDLAIGQPNRWLTVRIEDTVEERRKIPNMQRMLERTLLRRFHKISCFESDCYEAQKRAWS